MPNTLDDWFHREYPNNDIDWYNEYQRLLETLKQAVPSLNLERDASTKLLKTAIEVGDYLLDKDTE